MKLKIIIIFLYIIIAMACHSVSLEENIKQAIVEDTTTITAFEITDTIYVENLHKAEVQLDSAIAIFQEQIDSLPLQIAATERRLANVEKELSNNPFPSLALGWETIITEEKLTLTKLKIMLAETETQLKDAQKDKTFLIKAQVNQKNGVGYYIVEATIKKETKRFLVTPSFELLEH